jgi:hypothetical protein
MEFKETRTWIGKVGAVFIFTQITAIIVFPKVRPHLTLIMIEVSILGAVLGIDIVTQNMTEKAKLTHKILGVFVDEQNGSNDDNT